MIAARVRDVSPVLLGALAFLAPFAVDVSLPGLPAIGAAIHAPGGLMQWTLSAYVVATGIGQLVWGPISDRYGRRPVVLAGLALYAASAFGCAAVHDVGLLIALRFVQGIGACAGLVCAFAIIQDLAIEAHERASRQATISTFTNFGPLAAPIAGVGILAAFGWRPLYAVPAVLGTLALIAIALRLPETSPRSPSGALERYRRVLAMPNTPASATAIFALFGAYFAMIGGSPFALEVQLHLTPAAFAGAFACEALCALLGSFAASRLALDVDPPRLLTGAIALALAAGLANGITGALLPSAAAFVITMSVYAFAFGIALPSAIALVLAGAGADAGVASGIMLSALSFGGAAGAAFTGALPFAPTVAIGIVTAAGAAVAGLACLASLRANGST